MGGRRAALEPFTGWEPAQSGEAVAELIDGFAGNQVLRINTPGSEAAPGPVLRFSWDAGAAATRARVMFDLRISDVAGYTRVAILQIELEQRGLRFMVRTQPTDELVLQLVDLVNPDDPQVVHERPIPEGSFFDQMRLIELSYVLDGPSPLATVTVEGEHAAELPLDGVGLTHPPALRFGALAYDYPSSGVELELDNLGFDDD